MSLPEVRRISELIADPDTVLETVAVGDYLLVYDISEGLDTRKVKVVKRGDLVTPPPAASTTQQGIVELATNAETITGTDAARAVTPAGLAAKVAALGGSIHASAFKAYTAGGQVISSTSPTFTDVTNSSQNIVTTRTCTIIMIAFSASAVHSAGNTGHLRCNIGGVAGSANGFDDNHFNMQSAMQVRTGVSAGTITCKLQGASQGSGGTWQVISHQGYVLVLAIS